MSIRILIVDFSSFRLYNIIIKQISSKTRKDFYMKKTDAINLVKLLKDTYPDATCSLDFTTPFQMLSAQCTDERVNKTTPALFERCKTIQDFVDIDIKELEDIIHPCGFYKNKAKNIKLCAKQVLENFDGKVPDNMEDLQSLAGVR